jgi:hypothetical protein
MSLLWEKTLLKMRIKGLQNSRINSRKYNRRCRKPLMERDKMLLLLQNTAYNMKTPGAQIRRYPFSDNY